MICGSITNIAINCLNSDIAETNRPVPSLNWFPACIAHSHFTGK